MWLAANQGTIVSFIFLLQLLILQKDYSLQKTILLIIPLSLVSALTYESTLLFFIPILYLLAQKYPTKIIRLSLLNFIPPIIFFFTKFLITPQNPRPLVNNLPSFINNTQELFKNLYNVHFNPHYFSNFWTNYTLNGYLSFLQNPAILILLIFTLAQIFIIILYLPKTNSTNHHHFVIFWFLVFVCSLPPLLVNQTFYFGFRSLFLPSITATIFLIFLFQNILKKNSTILLKILCLASIPCFILIDSYISNQYEQYYQNDFQLAQKIVNLAPPHTTIILKSELPFNSQNTFIHADQFISCFYYEWCAPAILKSISPNMGDIIVKNYPNPLPQPNIQLLYKQDHTVHEIP
jgi:hypothetical protein